MTPTTPPSSSKPHHLSHPLPQEEYIKEEQKNLKRELLRAQEEVKRIQSVPLVIGQFLEMVNATSGIVGSTTGGLSAHVRDGTCTAQQPQTTTTTIIQALCWLCSWLWLQGQGSATWQRLPVATHSMACIRLCTASTVLGPCSHGAHHFLCCGIVLWCAVMAHQPLTASFDTTARLGSCPYFSPHHPQAAITMSASCPPSTVSC